MFYRSLLASVLVLFCSLSVFAEAPPVFTATSVPEAVKAASEKSGLVVVDFTATWCPPCKMMDANTWVDPETVAWLTEHAICVQVDVDEDEDTSRAYNIEAMPTVVAIVDGKEFEREVGYMDGDQLVAWLEGVRRGERKVDRLIALHGERVDEHGQVDTQARYQLAKKLTDNSQYDEALDEYLWLWQHMVEFEPSMVGVRSSFMASSMGKLVAAHEPARAAFAELRDQAQSRLEDKPDWDDLDDWIVLNKMVGDEDKTLEWFDRIKQDPDKLRAAGRVTYKFDDLLIERGRWADLGLVLNNPIMEVRQNAYLMKQTVARMQQKHPEVVASQLDHFHESSAQVYAACLAAGREAEAEEVAVFLVTQDDPPGARLAMIRMAIEAGVVRPQHLAWAAEVADTNPALILRVEDALNENEPNHGDHDGSGEQDG